MKKTINLKPGDPVTCMRRYYLGFPYHGQISIIRCNGIIVVSFDDATNTYQPNGAAEPQYRCSLIPGHIEPEPLTLPETVEFEKGDRVLALRGMEWRPAIYVKKHNGRHEVKMPGSQTAPFLSGTVREFDADFLFSQRPFEASERASETPVEPETQTDDTPKEGDWCLFWDEPDKVIILKKYRELNSILSKYKHVDGNGAKWVHARKLKPSDLSPELWEIIKNEEQ